MAYQDLLKDTSESKENGNYFLVTITDLSPNVSYPIQFRWNYKDNRANDAWSPFKIITTPGESEPNTPSFTTSNVDVSQPEKLIITWSGQSDDSNALENYDRVDVYIDGLPFDGEKAAYSFKTSGTAIIPAPAGTYQIALYAVSKTGKLSPVSSAVTKTVLAAGTAITSPEDPDVPTVQAGLASIIVSWSGKKSGGADLTTTGFAGARVYIGTSSNFTPSDNNWVHTLNFANGSNQVAVGVGTVIDKSSGAKLQYGTTYYIKIGTVNASGTTTGNYIASTPSSISVSKLPASEISTGILAADASITAGAESGARVVMSGASSPFIIYGTDGTTKLMEFIGGSTGTLSITGSGKFTGDLEIGSSNAIFKAQPATGIWLGNSSYASAPFSVSKNGVIKAEAGTIGGWTLGSTYLQGNNIKLDTSGITVGSTSSAYLDISATAITHRNANGTASGKFTLTFSNGALSLTGEVNPTSGTAVTTTALNSGLAGKISTGGALSDIGSLGITGTYIASDAISTPKIAANAITTAKIAANAITAAKIEAGTITANEISSSYIYAGEINADKITSGTITGRTMQTATSGDRIEINSNSNIYFYSGSTAVRATPGRIYPYTNLAGQGYLYLRSPGTAGSTIGLYSDNTTTAVRIDSDLLLVGSGASFDSGITATTGTSYFNKLVAYSTILANTLGTTSSNGQGAIYQDADGYLKVRTGTGSSIKLKDNVAPFESVEDYSYIINNMNLVTFNYKPEVVEDPWFNQLGMIVEDLVQYTDNEFLIQYKDNEPAGIYYEKIPLFLVGAFKEMTQKIESLQARLDALEA